MRHIYKTFSGFDDYTERLVGLGADGPNVHNGNTESVKTIMREEMPWLVFIWCMAHRLELAIEHALKGTIFDDVRNYIIPMYK